MTALANSVTLDDVLSVVSSRRVPIAPELAGYLILEIADGGAAPDQDVDPKSVFVGEEGSVALVAPRTNAGDAESSLREILGRLLEAGGSQAAALGLAAKKGTRGDLQSLIEELEAALIPVNRSAGRRALARLSREVKRVTAGVGRNASSPPPSRRSSGSANLAPNPPAVPLAGPPVPTAPHAPKLQPPAAPAAKSRAIPQAPPTPRPFGAAAAVTAASPRDAAVVTAASPRDMVRAARAQSQSPASLLLGENEGPKKLEFEFGKEDIDELLKTFEVSEQKPDLEVARDLKAMVGLEPTPPPRAAAAYGGLPAQPFAHEEETARPPSPPRAKTADESVEALLTASDAPPKLDIQSRADSFAPPPPPAPAAAVPPPVPTPLRREPGSPAFPTSASKAGPGAIAETTQARNPNSERKRPTPIPAPRNPKPERPTGRGSKVAFGLLLTLLAAAAATYALYPEFFLGRKSGTGPAAAPSQGSFANAPTTARQEATVKASATQALACRGSLYVKGAPPDAEILIRLGQAPLDAARLPVGTRIEFVATAEGYAPKRAVVTPSGTWDRSADGKQRVEVPIELAASKLKADAVESWPAAEAGTQVGGKGEPGTVHIVSSPRGAEIWLLAGLGAEGRYEPLPCDVASEILIAGPTQFRKRVRIEPDEVAKAPEGAEPGTHLITVNLQP